MSLLCLALYSATVALLASLPAPRNRITVLGLFFPQWLCRELAHWHIAIIGLMSVIYFITSESSFNASSLFYVLVIAVSISTLIKVIQLAQTTGEEIQKTLQIGLGLGFIDGIPESRKNLLRHHVPLAALLKPFSFKRPEVFKTKDISYGAHERHRLDIYQSHKTSAQAKPVLLQIHGGGWVIGQKEHQALPLMNHLAEHGWICVAINYRLSPSAKMPAHIQDCKQALHWIKTHIHEYGGDANFIAVTGGSAGGHLASLLALSAEDRSLAPQDLSDADLSVQACVPFYGVYDFTDQINHRPKISMQSFLEDYVMPKPLHEDPDLWRSVSPSLIANDQAPAMMIIHGNHDSIAFVEDARAMACALHDVSKNAVVYSEIQGAQHAFDIFNSYRSAHTVNGVQCFLEYQYCQYLKAQQ